MATALNKPDRTLDQRGLLCPLPVINTNKAIQELKPGQILEVLATDPGSKPDFDAWSKSRGHKILSVSQEQGPPKVFRFFIQRSG
ncbi:MAG: sulfurtransferase TusA family protein [Thaumarchaeota archaeon]|nr:sulfurtransferase TusA family protein [Nitrososphaerota archaeon]